MKISPVGILKSKRLRALRPSLPGVVLWALLGVFLPSLAQGVEVVTLSRNLFAGQEGRAREVLSPGVTVTVKDEIWSVPDATAIRFRSPDTHVAAVFRFQPIGPGALENLPGDDRIPAKGTPSAEIGSNGGGGERQAGTAPGGAEAPASSGVYRLTVILLSHQGPKNYLLKSGSQRMTGEGLRPRNRFQVEEGLGTDLAGATGQVTEVVIQDDGKVELRLSRQDGEVLVEVLSSRYGGLPSRPGPPWYEGIPLTFADYVFLGGGYTNHGFGDLWLFQTLSARVNAFIGDSSSLTLVRGLVTGQAWRSESFSLWVEGGGAYYAQKASSGSVTENEVTYAGGVTVHFRRQAWGGALQANMVGKNELLLMALGSWQFAENWSVNAFWHSFADEAELGIGGGVNF